MVSIGSAVLGNIVLTTSKGIAMTDEHESDFVAMAENRPLSTPTLTSLIEELASEEYCDSQEFLELLSKLHDLIGLAEIRFVNEYFHDGNGWPIMEELSRKQHIVNYVYVNIGVKW